MFACGFDNTPLHFADVAQSVEHLLCKQVVALGSSPAVSSAFSSANTNKKTFELDALTVAVLETHERTRTVAFQKLRGSLRNEQQKTDSRVFKQPMTRQPKASTSRVFVCFLLLLFELLPREVASATNYAGSK